LHHHKVTGAHVEISLSTLHTKLSETFAAGSRVTVAG
jgi:hypothetical protein